MSFTSLLLDRTKQLSSEVNKLKFTFDGYVYNPLNYAWEMHSKYLTRYVKEGSEVMFLGMNPGPYGMMQTGVPFGEVNAVKNFLELSGDVGHPCPEHPARPVSGLECKRSEVSGRRLWGLVEEVFGNADEFALQHSIFNYCPLGFLMNTKTAKNLTPDHLVKEERASLESVCDLYLKDMIELVKPSCLIGVGKYAMEKFTSVCSDFGIGNVTIDSIIHPSPGNPQANDNWSGKTYTKMKELGLWK